VGLLITAAAKPIALNPERPYPIGVIVKIPIAATLPNRLIPEVTCETQSKSLLPPDSSAFVCSKVNFFIINNFSDSCSHQASRYLPARHKLHLFVFCINKSKETESAITRLLKFSPSLIQYLMTGQISRKNREWLKPKGESIKEKGESIKEKV